MFAATLVSYHAGTLDFSVCSFWEMATMSRPPRVNLPHLNLAVDNKANSRKRSGSIVKVEEIGEKTTEEMLDRSAYSNINANWVNAKGE